MEVTSTYDLVSIHYNSTYTFKADDNVNTLWLPWFVLIVLTSIVGLITNGIVITAICKKSYKKSALDVLFIWYCVLSMCLLIDYIAIGVIHIKHYRWFLPDRMCPLYKFFSVFSRISTYTLPCLSLVNLVFYKDQEKRCISFELLVIFASIFISTAMSVPVPVPILSKSIHIGSTVYLCTSDVNEGHNIASHVLTILCPVSAVCMSSLFFVIKIASRKVTKVVVLRVVITVIFVVVWSPTWILTVMHYVGSKISNKDLYTIYMISGWFICLGCCSTSVAFLISNKSARRSLCCCKQNSNTRYELADMCMEETVQDTIMLQTNERE